MDDLFTPLEVAAWGGLVEVQGRLFQAIEDDLRRRSGITHAEFEVLLRLCFAGGGRARLQDLAAQSLLTRSGTSRAVDRLARAGWVERESAEEDGRGAYAVLTPAGRAHFFEAARHHVALVRREFLSHFRDDELRVLAGFWRRLPAVQRATRPDPAGPRPPGAARPPQRRRARSSPASRERTRRSTRRQHD